MSDSRKLIADALLEIVEQAQSGGPVVRVGLMAHGSELGDDELLRGAMIAQDGRNVMPVENQNYKYVSWKDIAKALDLEMR